MIMVHLAQDKSEDNISLRNQRCITHSFQDSFANFQRLALRISGIVNTAYTVSHCREFANLRNKIVNQIETNEIRLQPLFEIVN